MPATKIGDKIIRVDAIEKARGEATYVCDMTLPDMQYAYMVRSTVPRGTIDAIHLPEFPEGYYFISAKDIPAQGKNELWMIMKEATSNSAIFPKARMPLSIFAKRRVKRLVMVL